MADKKCYRLCFRRPGDDNDVPVRNNGAQILKRPVQVVVLPLYLEDGSSGRGLEGQPADLQARHQDEILSKRHPCSKAGLGTTVNEAGNRPPLFREIRCRCASAGSSAGGSGWGRAGAFGGSGGRFMRGHRPDLRAAWGRGCRHFPRAHYERRGEGEDPVLRLLLTHVG